LGNPDHGPELAVRTFLPFEVAVAKPEIVGIDEVAAFIGFCVHIA
jgi:hypothetical protein